MQTRVAVMSIIVENPETIGTLNALLHEYGEYIIGRMGIPYKTRNINIISILKTETIIIMNIFLGQLKNMDLMHLRLMKFMMLHYQKKN